MYITKKNLDLVLERILGPDHEYFARIRTLGFRLAQTSFILIVLGILFSVSVLLFTAPKAILGPEYESSFTQFGFSLTGIGIIMIISVLPISSILAYKLYQAKNEINFTYLRVLGYFFIILSATILFMLFWRVLIGFLCLVFLMKFFYFILLPQLFLTFSS